MATRATEEPQPDPPVLTDDQLALRSWRYDAARKAGLNPHQSIAFAESRADIGDLRRLARMGCSATHIVRLLL